MKIKQLSFITIFLIFTQLSSSTTINDNDIFNLMNQLFDFQKDEKKEIKSNIPKIKISDKEREMVKHISNQKLIEFQAHFNKYYPKVFVIREKFLVNMTPDKIAKVFDKIINIIAYKPWIYIQELFQGISQHLTLEEFATWRKKGFDIEDISKKLNNPSLEKILIENNGFEEFIADQLSFLHDFLHYSKVELTSQITFFDKRDRYSSYSSKSVNSVNTKQIEETLQSFWLKKGIKTAQDFYELCFSYFSRLFIKSINQEDLRLSNKYFDDLKKIILQIKNTSQEARLHEFIGKYKDLLDILKHRIYSTKFSFLKKDKELSELLDYWDATKE